MGISFSGYSQEDLTKKQFHIEIHTYEREHPSRFPEDLWGYAVAVNYSFTPTFRAGIALGYHDILNTLSSPGQSTITTDIPMYSVGLQGSYHFSELLFDNRNSRLDLYVKGKYGSVYFNPNDDEVIMPKRNRIYHGFYLGAAFDLSPGFGVFGEYGAGNYSDFAFGVVVRF
ncbi:porin family protein [Alkalitalea saponilacus]|uniref:Outer membrane protein beta-barrel domain-containing protein n=1 Tax=Alkalitalea saponilacus TaxID=889453 RepID=A0A1T5AX76_9BACT|nr:outer membrane beta-barrel protein [Alkalitalea saponilacus]SKB39419.1 Outer membrane protein beta-barrel domain-containing protein [Alkalitalea saponilacus]